MNGADRKDLLEAELCEFRDAHISAACVHLIDRNQDRLAAAAQPGGRVAIERDDPLLHVHHQDKRVRRFNGQFHLFERRFGNDIGRLFTAQQTDAAGIDQREGASMPFRFGADAVTRHARLIVDDSNAPANNAVEQG